MDAVAAVLAGRPVAPESARTTVDHNLAAVRGPLAAERMVALFDTLPVREDRGDGRRGHRRSDEVRTLPGGPGGGPSAAAADRSSCHRPARPW